MKNLVLLSLLFSGGILNAQNPMFKMNILKTNAIYYIKQPSYGHYTQNYNYGNGLIDASIEKRVKCKNYFGIGLNFQGRNYSLNYPDAGGGQLYKTTYGGSFISYYLKYNFMIDSGKKSNTYISTSIYYTREYLSKMDYYHDTIPPNHYSLKNRMDYNESFMLSPVIGITNDYKLVDILYFRSSIEFIPSGSGGRGFKNDSRLSINFGIQLRFY